MGAVPEVAATVVELLTGRAAIAVAFRLISKTLWAVERTVLLPTIRAAIELDHNHPAEALKLLQGAESFELGAVLFTPDWAAPLHPAYVRGEAYLRLHRGKEAAAEYQKFVDHWGAVRNF